MKKSLLWLSLVAVLVVAARADAQEDGTRFGVGVSLNPSALLVEDGFQAFFLPFGFGDIYFPIIVSERFKLEPQLGLFRFSSETKSDGFTSESSMTLWRLGAGLFYRLPASESLSAYVGPRFILLLSSESFKWDGEEDEISETDISIGAALGGEYFFSSHFSLGGEFQLNYLILGEPEDEEPDTFELDRSIISNNGLILLRWYF